MRFHIKYLFISVGFILVICLALNCFHGKNNQALFREIRCRIFDKYDQTCGIFKNEIYISVSEILSLFDVTGRFDKSQKVFYLKQNNLSLFKSNNWVYNSFGQYLFFEKYEVDLRVKVKVISIDTNVPISSQWNKDGYEYPIQIAQYGLSHFSKWIALKETKALIHPLNVIDLQYHKTLIHKAGRNNQIKLLPEELSFHSSVSIQVNNFYRLSDLIEYGNKVDMKKVNEYLDNTEKILSDLPEMFLIGSEWERGAGLHIVINNNVLGILTLVYMCGSASSNQNMIHNVFVYNIKDCYRIKLVRNLYVDVIKSISLVSAKNLDYISILKKSKLISMTIFGTGKISEFQLSNQFSYEKFIVAADWLVTNQNKNGGWPTNVTRRIYPSVKVNPGWYSAMAQGHGISLLIRAYNTTGRKIYLRAATKALKLFDVETTRKGVRTTFMERSDLVWYEEYPTNPSLFILNGFLYSLFGLLDYSKTQENNEHTMAAIDLFNKGIYSLKTLLPLFDSGFGSFYDLRHLTFPAAKKKLVKKSIRKWEVSDGPNRARWEYHVIHTEQLFYLANCFHPQDEFLLETAQRFRLYLNGYRSSHN